MKNLNNIVRESILSREINKEDLNLEAFLDTLKISGRSGKDTWDKYYIEDHTLFIDIPADTKEIHWDLCVDPTGLLGVDKIVLVEVSRMRQGNTYLYPSIIPAKPLTIVHHNPDPRNIFHLTTKRPYEKLDVRNISLDIHTMSVDRLFTSHSHLECLDKTGTTYLNRGDILYSFVQVAHYNHLDVNIGGYWTEDKILSKLLGLPKPIHQYILDLENKMQDPDNQKSFKDLGELYEEDYDPAFYKAFRDLCKQIAPQPQQCLSLFLRMHISGELYTLSITNMTPYQFIDLNDKNHSLQMSVQ